MHSSLYAPKESSNYALTLLRPYTLTPYASTPYALTPYAFTPYALTPYVPIHKKIRSCAHILFLDFCPCSSVLARAK